MNIYTVFIECVIHVESDHDAEQEAKRINDNIEGCEFVTTTDIFKNK